MLLTYPHFEAGRDQGYADLPESDPARVDRLNEIMAEAVALRPGVATLVDFQAWLAAQPGGELDPAKREDGLHFYDEYSPAIGEWLGPQLLELARNGTASRRSCDGCSALSGRDHRGVPAGAAVVGGADPGLGRGSSSSSW